MSLDHRNPTSNGKPITPKAPIRSKSSPYFTPKLANTIGATPSPELRRNDQATRIGVASRVGNSSNITPPLKTILTTNITPRSSSRKSRADSTNSTPNSTPNGTPINSRPVSVVVPSDNPHGSEGKSGIDAVNFGKAESVLSNVTSSARNTRSVETRKLDGDDTASPMFFHASDAAIMPKKPSISSKKGTGFVYADGRQDDSNAKRSVPTGSKPGSQVGTQAKLYHIKGRSRGSSATNASFNTDSPTISPILATPTMLPHFDQKRQRSTSPLKEFEVPGQFLPSTRRTSGASNVSIQSIAKSAMTTQSTMPVSSMKHEDNRTHVKTQSVSLLEACIRPKTVPNQSDPLLSVIHSLPSPHNNLPPLSFFDVQTNTASTSTPTSPLTSPSHTGLSAGEHKLDQLNAMATNARRERKVLDLEISNSSLLAINRTLEREMRKQKAELRRYRRLTSGGRLSIGPTERSVSGATTISTVSTLSFDSDLSSASDQETILTDMQSDEGESEGSDDSSLSLSPEAQAARSLRQKQRDEKRLQVDLSRHRQILIDSQKLNESLKRCLGWTDELILEGKKALQYQVQVNEIAIGGRVLHEDDNPGIQSASPRLGLLSPTNVYLEDTDETLLTSGMSLEGTTDHG